MDYNKTINLPKTDFPMRAGLPKREPDMLQHWNDLDLYNELLKKNEGKPLFSLHDGPPFSNGGLHMGHALNKSIKDFITRSYAMRGYYTPYIPGWDNHGMPIESAIIKEQKLNRKNMSVAEFRSACHDYAQKYIDIQMDGFKRMGVLGDWEHPYKTMDPGFEAEEVKVFGAMYKKGYIYKGLKPVYWCPHDETALAEAEIEYQDDPCTTVYVKFPVKDDLGKLSQYGDLSKTYFLIWTTTIWTLPGNMAIAVHPRESYVLVKADNGEQYILAEALTEKVMKAGGIEHYEIAARFVGSDFEYMKARHPFLDKDSLLCCAEYVTMDSGTGCVHTAPGFGADDYETCKRYKVELVVPVDDQARHTDYAGKYAGMKTDESNPVILNDMKESGMLFASEDIVHSYPHCWRCKKPIIFRATPQWFCSVDSFKDEACAACDDVRWVPGWGIDRMKSMIRERADWCISRQRRWGLPIPVFYCADCGKPVCTDETIEAVSKLFAEKGSNAWYEMDAADILPKDFACPHCSSKSGFTKEEDTLDGWFDSGSTHFASMQKDQGFWPATVYMEGLDQYRGWFQSSLLTAVGALGKGAPFKECITHGWTVDGEGKAMHKSLGNAVAPDEVIKEYGADMLRLWVASADYTQDMRISKEIMKQLSQAYLKIRNTARYMLGNLCDFDPDANLVPVEGLMDLDRYALHCLNELVKNVRAAYDRYEFHGVYRAIYNFCVVDMSNFYLDIIKDRLYCGSEEERRSAQTALYYILDGMTRLVAPILAFTSDEIWHAMKHASGVDAESVLLNDMPEDNAAFALDEAAKDRWAKLVALRDAVNKALENARNAGVFKKAQDTEVTVSVSAEDATFLKDVDLASLCIVSKVTVTTDSVEGEKNEECLIPCTIAVKLSEAPKCPRCWNHNDAIGTDGHHAELCPRCAAVVGE